MAGDDALIVEMKRKIHSLEQDLVSSSAVRKRLEQELSSLRTATQENSSVELQRAKERAERFQTKARKYQDELNANREKVAQEIEARERDKNTWQLRIRAAEKNNETKIKVLQADAQDQLDELESEREELQGRIVQLLSTVKKLREQGLQESRMSAQMDRAKRALERQRRKRGAAFAVVHTGLDSPAAYKIKASDAQHDRSTVELPTHVVQRNIVFELFDAPMLEETVSSDLFSGRQDRPEH